MLALQVHAFEGPAAWRLEEVPAPEPREGEVRVRVAANAISYVDLLHARGGYQLKPALPFVPGTEFSGWREDDGRPVTGTVFGGAWAERVCVPAQALAPLPEGCDLHAAAALPITGATALYALRDRAQLRAGETVLVLGAAGGTGLAAVQVAVALGARVVAGAGSEAKRAAALEAGADHAVDTARPDWRAAVQAAAPAGIDVVFDPVGGSLTDPAFRCLRWGGRHLVVGFTEGQIPVLKANLALLKGASLVGVDVRQFREREPVAAQQLLEDTVDLFERGALAPRLARVVPVAEWPAAMAAAADRATVGRVVIAWSR
ncbi:MAG: NADPH:quinone oxidoreductase family protein [Rubrivivax sp.]